MSAILKLKNWSCWMLATAMTLLLLLTYWLYQMGFSAGFQFDDGNTIAGVSRVQDVSDALAYIFDGRAGTAGRPLALASFLLQKDSWPNDPAAFFQVNTLIHLFNGILVYWFSYQLALFGREKLQKPAWFSLAVTALWLTLPLHVSASLMAVQRMATMSSTFVLLGLIGYVSGRTWLNKSKPGAYWLMSISVAMGTMLAVLCKESGALLPLYVLVLEVTLLRITGRPADLHFKRWAWGFLGVPVLLMAIYFAYRWPSIIGGYAIRTFSLHERLLTESRILWEYLGQIYLPVRNGIGPYHDNYPISKGWFDPASTAVAIGAWGLAVAGAWRLRRLYPAIIFGLLWFLAGHLIESSFVPLELYFEHRNYLASFGPLLAISVLIWNVPTRIWRISLAGLLLMVLLRLFVLGEVTHLWGQPLLSAKIWAEEHPQSVRATLNLAGSYLEAGDPDAARQTILEGYDRIEDDPALALYSVYLNCRHEDHSEFLARLEHIEPALLTGALEKNAANLLNQILKSQQQGACPHLSLDHLLRLTDLLLQNRRFQAFPGILVDLHFFKHRLYSLKVKKDLSLQELLFAFETQKEYSIAIAVARAMTNDGRDDEAVAFLDRAMSFAPRNPLVHQQWKKEIDKMKLWIERRRAVDISGN